MFTPPQTLTSNPDPLTLTTRSYARWFQRVLTPKEPGLRYFTLHFFPFPHHFISFRSLITSFLSVQSDVQYEQYVHTPHHSPSTNYPPPQRPLPLPPGLDQVTAPSPPSPTVKQEAGGVADQASPPPLRLPLSRRLEGPQIDPLSLPPS